MLGDVGPQNTDFWGNFGGGHFVLCKSGSPSQNFSWEHHFSESGQPKEHFDTHFILPWGGCTVAYAGSRTNGSIHRIPR